MKRTKTAAAAIKVEIPSMKIRFEDLAFLKSLENPQAGVRCQVKDAVKNRCMFLGLVVEANIPPCPKALAEWDRRGKELPGLAQVALDKKKWEELYKAANELRARQRGWNGHRPEAQKGLVLTRAGKDLLRRGQTKALTASVKGCV
jgi:hypothetical protein